MKRGKSRISTGLLVLALLSGCATSTKAPDGFEIEPASTEQPRVLPDSGTNKAALRLLTQAQQAAQAGQLDVAEARLERALRIEPRNAALWYYMAKLRLHQGQYSQAAGLAAKSNSLDKGDRILQADNWRIIAHARYQNGDIAGAQRAQQKAAELAE
ncbi:MAG: tetratricopeptide repeat protein [Proteobacteria bacterium]|jgi:tetratricopeptide (TPR) repeat protein|nr:tetratricopeptide repeat protein [Pseudomonadota bacterium]MCG6936505.1 tetratricopeptide repeat protein [Pseudomonadota bacterium]